RVFKVTGRDQRWQHSSRCPNIFYALDAPMKAKRMRSQSASVETNLSEAFDAIVCVPSAGKDGLVDL
ncbi:hypothetical protein ACTZO1_28115, partial [Klebsiella pneumoniae]